MATPTDAMTYLTRRQLATCCSNGSHTVAFAQLTFARHGRQIGFHRSLSFGWIILATLLVGCQPTDEPIGANETELQNHEPASTGSAEKLFSAIQAERWDLAWPLARQALVENADDPEVVLAAARAASMTNQPDETADLMVRACQLNDFQPTSLVSMTGKSLFDTGRLFQAIDLFETALEQHPDAHQIRQRLLMFLLGVGRTDRAREHVQPLIGSGTFDPAFLCVITDLQKQQLSPEIGDRMLELNSGDNRVRLGKARHLYSTYNDSEAEEILREILEKHPDFAPAHALLGQLLATSNRIDELPDWDRLSSEKSKQQASYWLAIGDWMSAIGDNKSAARAYWEATRLSPDMILPWDRIAKSIGKWNESRLATGNTTSHPSSQMAESVDPVFGSRSKLNDLLADIERRVSDLQDIRQSIKGFQKSKLKSQRHAVRLATLLARLGRYGEAQAWCQVASRLTRQRTSELDKVVRWLAAKRKAGAGWVSSAQQPALQMDLSSIALSKPKSSVSRPSSRALLSPQIGSTKHLRMTDASSSWNLNGVGGKSNPGNSKMMPLERSLGVGGGTIDYDLDGFPDLAIAGAGGTVQASDSSPNELLRNVNGQFQSVSDVASAGDRKFGQGVAVGDFNEDGFPDLFYANFGQNTLLINCGDGSFRDVTELMEDQSLEWTTCGAFVDFDLDGRTDLVTTNYCDARSTINEPCLTETGEVGPCHPLRFKAHGDVFFRSDGKGALVNATRQWKPGIVPGRGLGLLAGSLQQDRQAVYVANDMTANEYLTIDGQGDDLPENSAQTRGLAVDGRSRSQASMGIASGDMDLDGDLDLFVTGFANEHNIFYEQVSPGNWVDSTIQVGLMDPTLMVVGFGTEAIDLDNDGLQELLVTNGHITDFGDEEVPSQQPFQVFRRSAGGQFKLVDDDAWDEYFRTNHIGRSLWTIDANVDGLSDIVVTHTYEAAKLLLNQTQTSNEQIAFQLVGTQCSRDAIGATLTFQCDKVQRKLWCNSGDGFMCSNERLLRAGLGAAENVENVSVRWPDGSVDQYGTLQAGKQFLLIQGQSQAFRLNRE